jgi:hypothetical protein
MTARMGVTEKRDDHVRSIPVHLTSGVFQRSFAQNGCQ